MFSDEIINIILSFRENHPLQKILNPFIESYKALKTYTILEYYHENMTYECSFIEWYFIYRKLDE